MAQVAPTAKVAAEEEEEESRGAARRLAANLFLNPTVVRCFAEYWMREYTPLPVATGAPVPAPGDAGDPGAWMACLVRRALVSPAELVLRSQGGMAVAPTATAAHYVHVINFTAPTADFALALPLSQFARMGLGHVLLAAVPPLRDAHRFWKRVVPGGAMGQIACDQFRFGDELARAYRPSLVLATLVELFLEALLAVVPADRWLRDVPPIVERALEPLRGRNALAVALQHTPEQQILAMMRERVLAHCRQDPTEALRTVRALRENLATLVWQEYCTARTQLDRAFLPEDVVDTFTATV